jgi:hypothetical protein
LKGASPKMPELRQNLNLKVLRVRFSRTVVSRIAHNL